MAVKTRLDRAYKAVLLRRAGLRSEYDRWWSQFTDKQLERLASGDKYMIDYAMSKGYERISRLGPQVLTADELRELSTIENELSDTDH